MTRTEVGETRNIDRFGGCLLPLPLRHEPSTKPVGDRGDKNDGKAEKLIF
ncbi:MAG: hypothetical protein IJU78_08340 [Clostridia bacterium]|nr:hypothetical protein [Clostridia bacterium]